MCTPSTKGETVFGPDSYQRFGPGNQIGGYDVTYRVPTGTAAIYGEGTITATNDFTVLGGGTFLIELDIVVGRDFNNLISDLALTGNVNIGGDLIISGGRIVLGGITNVGGYAQLDGILGVPIDFKPEPNASFTVLTAGKGVDGKFSGFNNPYPRQPGSLLYLDLKYEGNAVVVEAVQNDFRNALSIFRLTGNQQSTATALDGALSDPRQDAVITYLNGFDINAIPELLDRIAPEELSSIYSISFARMNSTVSSVQNRFAEIRSSGESALTAVKDFNPGPTSSNSAKEATVRTQSTRERYGFFANGSGNFSSIGNTANANGYDTQSGIFLTGFDALLNESLTTGVLAGYAQTNGDFNEGGAVDVDSSSVAIYAQYTRNTWFTESMIGGSYNRYNTDREALNGKARGDTDGGEVNAYLSFGKDLRRNSLIVTPFASLLFSRVGIEGYDERGSLQPLHIESQNADSLRSRIGLRAAQTFTQGNTSITPYATAQWQYEYMDDALAVSYRFSNGAGGTSTAYGPKTGRHSLLVSSGVRVDWDQYACYLSYQADIGRKDYEDQTVLTGFRVSW